MMEKNMLTEKEIKKLACKLVYGMVFDFEGDDIPGGYFEKIKENAKAGYMEQYIFLEDNEVKLLTEPPVKDPDDILLKITCTDDKIFVKAQQ